MRPLLFLFAFSCSLGAAAHASPYDYAYGSMGYSNERSRENSFSNYLGSGSYNYGSGNIDFSSVNASIAKLFAKPAPTRYKSPPALSREERLNEYWANYHDPDYSYTPPVKVTRSPQQKRIDEAQDGNTAAMCILGNDYLDGRDGFAENASSGIYWLKTAFEHGRTEAAMDLFHYFASDAHPQHDEVQSLFWLQKAAKAGDGEAMTMLGTRILQGAGFDVDPVEGVRLLKAGLQAGDKSALLWLSTAYEQGWGVPKDLSEAIKWQREAVKRSTGPIYVADLIGMLAQADDPKNRVHTAEILDLINANEGDPETRLLHAKLADLGVLGAPDPAKCVEICQQIIAENDTTGGNSYRLAEANELLGEHLYEGRGVAKDEIAAYAKFRAASAAPRSMSALSGFHFALLLTGRLKTKNDDGTWSVLDDPATALPLLFNAENNEESPKPLCAQAVVLAAHELGAHPELQKDFPKRSVEGHLNWARIYDHTASIGIARGVRDGWFGAPDNAKSRDWLKTAIMDEVPGARGLLARWECEDSDGKDPEWQRDIAVALGENDWEAHKWMSDQLISGKYLPPNLSRAQAMLRIAATRGNDAQAQNNLGVALWKGTFGTKNVAEGLGWMEKSLGNGFWVGGRNLAKIYHLGLDVEKDELKAKTYLEKAGEIGGDEAAQALAEAYVKGEIIDADADAAAKWKAKARV